MDVAVIDSGHLNDEQIADLAAGSQAKVMICSHLYRELNAERLYAAAKDKGYAGQLIIGADRMSMDLG